MKSKSHKPTVTVGIPAFNEEANIKSLVTKVISQERTHFILKEIIIVLDRCTDKTEEEVKKVSDKRIKVLKNKERIGQSMSQNKIIETFDSDILILLNADVLIGDDFLEEIIKPFKNSTVSLVSGKVIPLKARNFFEHTLNTSVLFKTEAFEKWNRGDNMYLCYGRGRAFKKEFAKKLRWPKIFSEDIYSYLFGKINGYAFQYQPLAKIYFRSPSNLQDHLKQSIRYQKGFEELSNYFPKPFLETHFNWPKQIMFQPAAKAFIKEPLTFLYYLLLFSITFLLGIKKGKVSIKWTPSETSKKLT